MKSAIVITITLGVFGGASVARDSGCRPASVPEAGPPDPGPVPVVDAAVEGAAPDQAGTCSFTPPRSVLLRVSKERRALRIVGGALASENKYPFAVGIATASRFLYCGGTLLDARHVLTAAHCQVDAGDLALVGSVDLAKARAVRISESRIHPLFSDRTLDYDVAIAVLSEDAGVAAVSLPTATVPAVATVVGWGATREGGEATTNLRQVDVPLWAHSDCKRVYPELTSRQVCAGLAEGGADSCQGDSGGALLLRGGDVPWRQLGIVSYGEGCARPGVPGVYTDVRAREIRSWIEGCGR